MGLDFKGFEVTQTHLCGRRAGRAWRSKLPPHIRAVIDPDYASHQGCNDRVTGPLDSPVRAAGRQTWCSCCRHTTRWSKDIRISCWSSGCSKPATPGCAQPVRMRARPTHTRRTARSAHRLPTRQRAGKACPPPRRRPGQAGMQPGAERSAQAMERLGAPCWKVWQRGFGRRQRQTGSPGTGGSGGLSSVTTRVCPPMGPPEVGKEKHVGMCIATALPSAWARQRMTVHADVLSDVYKLDLQFCMRVAADLLMPWQSCAGVGHCDT